MKKLLFSLLITFLFSNPSNSQELIIGKERIEPGILLIFEGAIKDHVSPNSMHLQENQTNVHIEARVNWDEKNIPPGAPKEDSFPTYT